MVGTATDMAEWSQVPSVTRRGNHGVMTLTTSFPPCNLDGPLDVLTPLFLFLFDFRADKMSRCSFNKKIAITVPILAS